MGPLQCALSYKFPTMQLKYEVHLNLKAFYNELSSCNCDSPTQWYYQESKTQDFIDVKSNGMKITHSKLTQCLSF